MSRGMNRAQRLREMERLYLERAWTDQEIAKELGVRRETVYEDRIALQNEDQLPIIEVEGERGRYRIDRSNYLSNIRVNLHEALALYLAMRRVSRQTRTAQPHVQKALEKIALTLKQPMTAKLIQIAAKIAQQPADPSRVKVMQDLAQGWAFGYKVRIEYDALSSGETKQHIISPYLIEPSQWSDTIYVIAASHRMSKPTPFVVARITQSFVMTESFTLPDDFDEQELTRYAWGIWTRDREPEMVKLKFTGTEAVKRMKETIWHPLQKELEQTSDGGWLWQAPIVEWQEMVPWIRGWGSDVEVVEPRELRAQIVKEVKRMARRYGIEASENNTPRERVLRCWGKTGKTVEEFHPAVFHMLDVGNVARVILNDSNSARWRNVLADAFGTKIELLSEWVPYVVALHDIGKISMAFQALNSEQKTRLEQEHFSFAGWHKHDEMYHATISQAYVAETLASSMGVSLKVLSKAFGEALGGHHGQFVDPEILRRVRHRVKQETSEWDALRNAADAILRGQLFATEFTHMVSPPHLSKAIMALTGFTILCDWLGSDARYFSPMPEMDLGSYLGASRERAERVVREAGVLAPSASNAPLRVETLFEDLGTPRHLQLAINEISDEILRGATLTIIEAPTGEGKTEAALALARHIGHLNGTDEMYYALPTMATSNQMFGRLETHLAKRLGLASSVKLVHGQAFLVEEELRAETPMAFSELLGNGSEQESQARASMQWFNSKKRALLAPFGVGTIDQAELAALNVNHAALRMMGLAGKVVIVDEVHAYDTYMTTIIARLLRWLGTMNTSVILLSATLPIARRKQLTEEYRKGLASETDFVLSEEPANAYPNLVTVGANDFYQTSPQVWQPNRVIEVDELHFGDGVARAKAEWLLKSIADGGCVCWMTNTVKRAQRIFDELLKLAPQGVELDLLHSQFPLDERRTREVELSDKYGRDKKRPPRAIVVGTQVLEQSLDLDFDVMVSDLAPIDLLLQRAGRLHRHERARPAAHDAPRLYVNFELDAEGKLKRGTDKTIYAEYIMLQTHHLLKGRSQIFLPQDYRVLIKAVYAEDAPSEESPFYNAWTDLVGEQQRAEGEAKKRLLPAPHPRDSFAQNAAAARILFKEDENSDDFIVAKTRLGEETLNVIPLEREGEWAVLEKRNEKISMLQEAPLEIQRRLLRRNLRVSNRDLMAALRAEGENVTVLFRDSALLKEYYPLWLSNGTKQFPVGEKMLRVTLHEKLGLVIEKEGKADDTTE